MNFEYGVPGDSVTVSALIGVVSVVVIKVFFAFKMYIDMFLFRYQSKHHVQANPCQ
jgi:hypothetical protein